MIDRPPMLQACLVPPGPPLSCLLLLIGVAPPFSTSPCSLADLHTFAEPIDRGPYLSPCAQAQPLGTVFCCNQRRPTCDCESGPDLVRLGGAAVRISMTEVRGTSTATTSSSKETATTSPTATTSNVTGETSQPSASSATHTLTVGLSVGISVGVVLLAGITYWVWRVRIRKPRLRKPPRTAQEIHGTAVSELLAQRDPIVSELM